MIVYAMHQQADLAWSFFQSPPQSPVAQPTDTPVPPTNTPVPPTNTPVPPPPTETPVLVTEVNPEPPSTDAVVEGRDAQAQDQSAPPAEVVVQPETQQPAPPPEIPDQQSPPDQPSTDQQPVASNVEAILPEPVQLGEVPATDAGPESGVVVNWVALIDVATQMFAWVWLCVGVVIILLIPFAFLFMQIRGARLNR